MTLYTFDKDVQASGRSSCNGQCAVTWPPLMASLSDAKPVGDYTLIAREGGGQQWAIQGKAALHIHRRPEPERHAWQRHERCVASRSAVAAVSLQT